jgi:hypothetical protein
MEFSEWAYYTTKHVNVDDSNGVFQLSINRNDESKITYIGYGRLRTELLKYILGDSCRSPSLYFRYKKIENEEEAKQTAEELMQQFIDKYEKLPKCNQVT